MNWLDRRKSVVDIPHLDKISDTYVFDKEVLRSNQEYWRKTWYALQKKWGSGINHTGGVATNSYETEGLGFFRPLTVDIQEQHRQRLAQWNLKIFANHQSLLDIPYIMQAILEQTWEIDELYFIMRSSLPKFLVNKGGIPVERDKEKDKTIKDYLMSPVRNHQEPLRAKQLQHFVPRFFSQGARSLAYFPQGTRKSGLGLTDFTPSDIRRMTRTMNLPGEQDCALADLHYGDKEVHMNIKTLSSDEYRERYS